MFIKSAINYICYFVSHNLVASAEKSVLVLVLVLGVGPLVLVQYWYWYLLVEYLIQDS